MSVIVEIAIKRFSYILSCGKNSRGARAHLKIFNSHESSSSASVANTRAAEVRWLLKAVSLIKAVKHYGEDYKSF